MKFIKRLFILALFLIIGFPMVKAEAGIKDMSIAFRGHVQDIGWMEWMGNGGMIGTTGRAKRLEAFNLDLTNFPPGAKIKYQVHVQNIGWMDWTENGNMAGTTGRALQIEAVKISVENMPSGYYIQYQAHVQDIGWMDWTTNGNVAGTTGQFKRLEALNIRLIKDTSISLESEGYYHNVGWSLPSYNGNSISFINNNIKMEGISIKVNNAPGNMFVQYQTHSENIGWQPWESNGKLAGTTGQGSKMEALRVRLIDAPPGWHIRYRSFVEGIGWQQWVEDGDISGTVGQNKKVFAIGIEIYYDNNVNRNNIKYYIKNFNFSFDRFSYRALERGNNKLLNGTPANENILNTYANPDNLLTADKVLQFLTVNKYRDNMNIGELNKYLNSLGSGNVFANQGQAFVDAARDYGIDPLYLVAHTLLETGYGKSTLAKGVLVNEVNKVPVTPMVVYNFFGIGAIDSDPLKQGSETAYKLGWTSPAAAIRGGAQWIASNYLHSALSNQRQYTVYYMKWNVFGFVESSSNTMWHQYATDVNWANGIAGLMNRLIYLYDGAVLELEIPLYKQ
ncbi:glucosaminidase domain-containing protein [Alloiococcus sp. CFN-8]|uniref:glucosaminidase domain-containing protein n=1 Tax=Alloiococcus sp. CFN-8 TaxID=3416081 RepID=UPI003CEBED9D